jgi:hypothetical protein
MPMDKSQQVKKKFLGVLAAIDVMLQARFL